ncbi:lipopolysaccharide kinase [Pseudomonas agarici]|uniref:Lipopolysaccharide kinase n=1 Tax=Pseudomonas agarici TaxID=46677 RepID=A0A0X1T6J5_PSEAA|nr:lipopolysaccharide kinase InaA family protein [Pseudomonas agarici]AMB87429.1 lipopolysaccharide kinase [Pseudomonas agarici]NWB90892.1 lipopolysaccharide kinase [Pseudomonas agarici]NWC11514.1 lipopolysaccharide kinase [Pseudomonas agarici]SEK96797.1 Lipopolysaccharide kinase (Kdo/WaaP) family protein [Pseudomonas agarici]
MSDFLAATDRALLERNGLGDFDALWAIELDAVDEPNTSGGGWSRVFRLELEGQRYYLKRQSNYLTRTLHRPLGEPTLAREFRNISRYQRLGIPALQAVFFGERNVQGERRAMLLTRALDGWNDLDSLLAQWAQMRPDRRQAILRACGLLARQLHALRQVHGCFYPKHIFLRPVTDDYQAQLIDLEKTRPLLFGRRDRVKDLEPLMRRAPMWSESEVGTLLAAYLDQPLDSPLVAAWLRHLDTRRGKKGNR